MTNITKYDILRSLEFNGADECQAASGYCDLIELCEQYLEGNAYLISISDTAKFTIDPNIIRKIIEHAKEYMAEEYKHAIGLRALVTELSGIEPEK